MGADSRAISGVWLAGYFELHTVDLTNCLGEEVGEQSGVQGMIDRELLLLNIQSTAGQLLFVQSMLYWDILYYCMDVLLYCVLYLQFPNRCSWHAWHSQIASRGSCDSLDFNHRRTTTITTSLRNNLAVLCPLTHAGTRDIAQLFPAPCIPRVSVILSRLPCSKCSRSRSDRSYIPTPTSWLHNPCCMVFPRAWPMIPIFDQQTSILDIY